MSFSHAIGIHLFKSNNGRVKKTNKSELWNRLTYRVLIYIFEVRIKTFFLKWPQIEVEIPILKNKKIKSSEGYVEKVVSLIKERAVFVKDFWSLSSYFFKTPEDYDEKASKKQWKEGTSVLMNELIIVLASIDDFSSKTIEETVKSWISSKEIGFGKIMQPLRLAIVGEMKGPHLFDIIAVATPNPRAFWIPAAASLLDITITGMALIDPDCMALTIVIIFEPLPEIKIATRFGIKVNQCNGRLNL